MIRYSVQFTAVSVSAAQDLFTIQAASDTPMRILRIGLNAEGVTSAGDLRLNYKRLTSTVTLGSGGTIPTPREVSQYTAVAAAATIHANDTTRAITTGTIEVVWPITMQQLNNLDDVFIPELVIHIRPTYAFVFGLEAAPGSAITLSGGVMFEELKS